MITIVVTRLEKIFIMKPNTSKKRRRKIWSLFWGCYRKIKSLKMCPYFKDEKMWHFEECFPQQMKRAFWFRYKIKTNVKENELLSWEEYTFPQLSIVVTPWATLILLCRAKKPPSSCYLVVNPQLEICNAIDFHRHVWDYLPIFFKSVRFINNPCTYFHSREGWSYQK